MKFESKFEIEELVEVEPQETNQNENCFGFITSVKFHKNDAVNFCCSYDICLVNSWEVLKYIPETEILKSYGKKRP